MTAAELKALLAESNAAAAALGASRAAERPSRPEGGCGTIVKQFASEPVEVGGGFTVEFTFTKQGIICEWSPDVPAENQIEAVYDRYVTARDHFTIARLCRKLGKCGPITTILRDVPGGAG